VVLHEGVDDHRRPDRRVGEPWDRSDATTAGSDNREGASAFARWDNREGASVIQFLDSAYPPTPAQAAAAKSSGVTAWAFYAGGPGAFNVWSFGDMAVLRDAPIEKVLPIWVPLLDLSGDPVDDADTLAGLLRDGYEVGGAACLDTEASMRGNPRLVPYVDAWVARIRSRGHTPVIYTGGDYWPPGCAPWLPGQPPGNCPPNGAVQYNSGMLAELEVDYDLAGYAFPFARFIPAPSAGPTIPQEVIMGLPTGCTDQGAVRCQIRQWWDTYRTDPMTPADQNFWAELFNRPADEPMLGIPGMAGDPDLLLAGIVDNAKTKGVLRPAFAGAV